MIENILALIQAVKTENNLRKFGLFYTGNQGHNDNFMVKVHFSALRSCDIYNKNTRTLGAGDYPALKFFLFLLTHQTVMSAASWPRLILWGTGKNF